MSIMLMPHSMEAEQVVLGVLINEDRVSEIEDILKPADFYYEKHRDIYKSMLDLRTRKTDIDLITLREDLNTRGVLEKCGGISYLSQLSSSAIYLNNIKSYGEIILGKARRRQVISGCMKAIDDSRGDVEVEEVVQDLEDHIHKAYSDASEEMESIMDVLQDTITHIEKRYNGRSEIEGVTTGYKDLDEVTSGLKPGDLVIIAARPSMGKTALALNIASNVSKDASVAIFSLEMPKVQLMQRMLSAKCVIPLKNIKNGKLSDEDFEKLMKGTVDLSKRKIFIDDTSTTISAIRAISSL
ncbi:MAG: DnaB-like helicase C-terminal domain-containing protein [Clostridium sp.]